MLEIGAGIGNLTQLLLERAGRVVAVEQDRQFAPCLKELQRRHGHLKVIWGDALVVDFPHFDKAVANLPYQVALPIVFKLLNQRFERAVLMLPKRLAKRLCATVGQPGYCRIGVAVGRLAQVEWIEQVGKDAFSPRPEVESALVLIRRIKPKFAVPSEDFFRQVLENLFARRPRASPADRPRSRPRQPEQEDQEQTRVHGHAARVRPNHPRLVAAQPVNPAYTSRPLLNSSRTSSRCWSLL